MIVSFHPIIEADENRLCAGRIPDSGDLRAIRQADAVILPQGCSETLYRMARSNCTHIFPHMDIRFDYPGKLAQIRLFRQLGLAHPETVLYRCVSDFYQSPVQFDFPWIIKLNWGGQGDGVWIVASARDLNDALDRLTAMEATGQSSFLAQKCIDTRQRSLRVALIGRHTVAYWRIQSTDQPFGSGVAAGARIDYHLDPGLQHSAIDLVQQFSCRTQLQLGGFDFIFDHHALSQNRVQPLFLEVNYFFGRTGLGGSDAFYRLFAREVDRWLAEIGLPPRRHKS